MVKKDDNIHYKKVEVVILYVMGFSLLSEMEFFAVPKNGISLNI